MNALPLPGLKGTEPIGFLAAVGLLRVLSARRTFGAVKLGWSDDSAWTAVLSTAKVCEESQLVNDLIEHLTGRGTIPVFGGRDPEGKPVGGAEWKDIKVDPELCREWLLVTRSATSRENRETTDFLSAFGSELITARSSGDLKPTAFHMTAARQQFLEICRRLAGSLAPPSAGRGVKEPSAAFQEALFGPWEYGDQFSALGFDPNTEAVYALAASAPTGESPVSVRAAVWLAVKALPMFPVLPAKGRLQTRGFDLHATAFRWPRGLVLPVDRGPRPRRRHAGCGLDTQQRRHSRRVEAPVRPDPVRVRQPAPARFLFPGVAHGHGPRAGEPDVRTP